MASKPIYVARVSVLLAAVVAAYFYFIQPRMPPLWTDRQHRNQYNSDINRTPINSPQTPQDLARNTTLGFEKILALSRGTAWRLNGLNAASQLSGLDIEIPKQPYIGNVAVNALQSTGPADSAKPTRGSAIAWLAHLDLLKYIIQRDFATTLIMEDDMDWATEIKDQMSTLSDKARQFTKTPSSNADPYGNSWDVLWLGLCGETWLKEGPPDTLSWPDDTAGSRANWRGIYEPKWLMGLPEGHRSIFWSQTPICTYAYAISRAGATKLLEWASNGQAEAYDLKLQKGCTEGHLKCLSIVDQLFHHYRPPAEFGQGSDIVDTGINWKTTIYEGLDRVKGSTGTILHSARCKALFNTTCLDTGTAYDRPFRDRSLS